MSRDPKHKGKIKVKCTLVQALRLCTGRTAHRGSRSIALLFHDHGTRRWWGVSLTSRSLFTPGKDPVPIVQEDPKYATLKTNLPSSYSLKIFLNIFLRLVNVSEIWKNIKIRVTRAAKIQHSAIFFPTSAWRIWEFNQSISCSHRLRLYLF